MKNRDVDFFRPLWRRIAVTAVCVIWAGLELWHGEQTWIYITLGLTAYAVWSFFIKFPKEAPAEELPATNAAGDAPSATPAAVENTGDKDVPPQS